MAKKVKEFTVEERLEHAYKQLTNRFVDTPMDPPQREIKVGDRVDIGNLEKCEVIGLRDEGRVVLVKHMTRPRDHPKNAPDVPDYGAFWWFDCMPDRRGGAEFSADPAIPSYSSSDFGWMIYEGCCRKYFDKQEYQRDYVWTQKDKERFLESAFLGYDLGKFVFVEYDYPENRTFILDGKQRISTAVDFVLGYITYRGKKWWELTWEDRMRFESRLVQSARLNGSKLPESHLLRVFLEINAAGVPQTEEHLARVRKLYEAAVAKERKGS